MYHRWQRRSSMRSCHVCPGPCQQCQHCRRRLNQVPEPHAHSQTESNVSRHQSRALEHPVSTAELSFLCCTDCTGTQLLTMISACTAMLWTRQH